MKLLLTTIAAVLLVGCGNSQESSTLAKQSSPTATKSPPKEFYEAAENGNLEELKKSSMTESILMPTRVEMGKQFCTAPLLKAI